MAHNPLNDFKDWFPSRIFREVGDLSVEWTFIGDGRFTDPFFEDTLRRKRDGSQVYRTSIDTLGTLSETDPGIGPNGFIFHLSRCGSTLVSQILAASPENIVISEAPPIDHIVRDRSYEDESGDLQMRHLRSLISVIGRKRSDTEKYLFIKFDSWHTLNLNLFRRAYPSVPWIFLYRDPLEIIVSQLRRRGLQMVPGLIGGLLPGFDIEDLLRMSAEEYCARTLGNICKHALEDLDERGRLINYCDLPEIVFSDLFEHFSVSYDNSELKKMREAARFDAKMPQSLFKPDSAVKKASAGENVHAAAQNFAKPYYLDLEKIRLEQPHVK